MNCEFPGIECPVHVDTDNIEIGFGGFPVRVYGLSVPWLYGSIHGQISSILNLKLPDIDRLTIEVP